MRLTTKGKIPSKEEVKAELSHIVSSQVTGGNWRQLELHLHKIESHMPHGEAVEELAVYSGSQLRYAGQDYREFRYHPPLKERGMPALRINVGL